MVPALMKRGHHFMCIAIERALAFADIEYTDLHLEGIDQAQTEEWKITLGTNASIVVTDTEAGAWSWFSPDKIDQVAAARTSSTVA